MKCFAKATIEISSICNAHCTWCTTGIKNRSGCGSIPEYMTAEEFEKGICYMLGKNIIDKKTEIELYNWGEPFLNKNINDIAGVITKYGLSYHLSTNASVYREIAPENLKNLTGFRVSLSGFSKETYSITHGLNFSVVMENIIKFRDMLSRANRDGVMEIAFLVYKFNCHEIDEAREFFAKMNIRMASNLAYFANYDDFIDFASENMGQERAALAEKHIFTSLWRKQLNRAPENYNCPQDNFLVLSHKWEVVPCCFLTDKDKIGDLFQMNLEDIRAAKSCVSSCGKCKRESVHFALHNHGQFTYSIDPPVRRSMSKIYFDTGKGFSEGQVQRCPLSPTGHNSVSVVLNYSDALRLRFDPCDSPCFISDAVFYADDRQIGFIKHNGQEYGEGVFAFNHSDPWFLFDLPAQNVRCFRAEYDIACCSKEMMGAVLGNCSNSAMP